MKRASCYFVVSTIFLLISCLLAGRSLFSPSPALAQESFPQPWATIEPGRCVQELNVGGQMIEVATIQGFECLFINIVRILVPIAGLALFIMLIVGSFQLLTSGGDAKAVQKARATLTYAILGLVLFLGIWFILRLIQTITGVDVTKFEIPGPL